MGKKKGRGAVRRAAKVEDNGAGRVSPPRSMGPKLIGAIGALAVVVFFISRMGGEADPGSSTSGAAGTPPSATSGPWLRTPSPFVRDIDRVEDGQKAIGKAVKASVIAGVRRRDWAQVARGLTADFEARFPAPGEGEKVEDAALDLHELAVGTDPIGKQAFIDRLKAWFGGLASIERARWSNYQVLLDPGGKLAFVAAHVSFAGVGETSRRLEWQGSVKTEAVLDGSGWRLRRLAVVEGTASNGRLPPFREVGALVGVSIHDSADNQDITQRMIDSRRLFSMGGLSVLDFDDDGFWDVIGTRHGQATTLFRNDGKGGFSPHPLPALNLPGDAAKMYLSVDLDNDGRSELVSTDVSGSGDRVEMGLYHWPKKKMRRRKGALRFERRGVSGFNYEGVTACDVNGDQLLDLFFVGYDHAGSGLEAFNAVHGTDGLRNLLFINQGGLRFVEASEARGISGTQYSYVAECHDFDRDGDADLFVGNDYGQNNYYDNKGQGRFEEDTSHPFHHGRGFSMGLSMADYDNTGRYAVSISNMYSHAGNRIVPLVEGLSERMHSVLTAFAAGNTLFEQVDGKWVDVAKQRRVDFAEWAWGNVFFDVDNDADKDLYVVNGFTTHRDPTAPDY